MHSRKSSSVVLANAVADAAYYGEATSWSYIHFQVHENGPRLKLVLLPPAHKHIHVSCLFIMSSREGVAQAAADEAAMLAPPSPPPEPAANTPNPSRSRRTPAPAEKPVKPTSKKAAAGVAPRRKSKPAAVGSRPSSQQQTLLLPDVDPSPEPAAEPGFSEAPAPEAVEDAPAELCTAIAAWQQFDEQAKGLLVGRPLSDNMVQLLLSQVKGKQPDQVIVEVQLKKFVHRCGSRDYIYICSLRVILTT